MVQAILLSLVAGVASALLSGILSPLSPVTAFLFVVAPLPLMIVGLGWHPLLAALGALLACLLMSIGLGHRAAIAYGVIVGGPAWLLCEAVIGLFVRHRPLSTHEAGLRIGAGALAGCAFLAAAICVVGALSVDFDFTRFQTRLATVLSQTLRTLVAGETLPQGVDLDRFAAIYVGMLPPTFTFVSSLMLTLSLVLAVKVARKSDRLPFDPPPLFLAALPRESVFLFIGFFALAQLGGWLGLIGVVGAAALTFCFTATGIAVLHMKTLGRSERPFLLAAAWASMFIFIFAAFVFTIIGALDAFFDFRRLKSGGQPPSS